MAPFLCFLLFFYIYLSVVKYKEKFMILNKDSVYFHTTNSNNRVVSEALSNQTHKPIGHITISVNTKKNSWMISEWFVDKEYQNRGIGKNLFKQSLNYLNQHFPLPSKVEYIWNGANQYVFDWLQKNFAPVSQCPIFVQKYCTEDDWSSHIYTLDVRAVFSYFEINAELQNDIEK